MTVQAYVAAGSNVDARRQLGVALAELERSFAPLDISPAYANKAVGFDGEDFINLVVGFRTSLPLAALIARLQEIETRCGRPREAPKYGPRSMDLDLLLYGEVVGTFPGAVLPRPDLVRRPYMLGPLADLAPTLMHPTLHRTIGELWAEFDRTGHALRPVAL